MTPMKLSPAELARLRVAISSMMEPRRSVYFLCARAQLEYPEIASQLGLIVYDVERHLAEALVELLAAIDRDDEGPQSLQ